VRVEYIRFTASGAFFYRTSRGAACKAYFIQPPHSGELLSVVPAAFAGPFKSTAFALGPALAGTAFSSARMVCTSVIIALSTLMLSLADVSYLRCARCRQPFAERVSASQPQQPHSPSGVPHGAPRTSQ